MRLVIGDVYTCKAKEILKFGAIMEFEDGSTQLLHISNIAEGFIKNIEDYITVGETYKVLAIKGAHHPVEITMKGVDDVEEIDYESADFGDLLEHYLPTNKDKYYKQDTKYVKQKKR